MASQKATDGTIERRGDPSLGVEHELPDNGGHVQFQDARIEYEDRDGHLERSTSR